MILEKLPVKDDVEGNGAAELEPEVILSDEEGVVADTKGVTLETS